MDHCAAGQKGRRQQPAQAARVSADLIGKSSVMQRLRNDVAMLAASNATVLLTGASGTGKENVARALHSLGPRSAHRFEAVNCGAIPAALAEAELFGTEAGAFTGATKARAGRVEAAAGGTLFLDEIGDLPMDLQVKLLRVLETGEVERLGGGRSVPVDIRIIAATNVDLEQAVAEGRFRADLFWRLAVVWLDLPSLKERIEDLPLLIEHFCASRQTELILMPDGLAVLEAHSWPGNLRELRNLIERALALGETRLDGPGTRRLLTPRRRTMPDWLAQPIGETAPLRQGSGRWTLPGMVLEGQGRTVPALHLKDLLAEAEASIIRQALDVSGGTIAGSARMLGLNRTTLIEKMKRMGLKAPVDSMS